MVQHAQFHFCPVCGARLRSTRLEEKGPARLVCSSCDFIFYLDPKVVACSIPELDGAIVLLRRGISPQKGKWAMPGGYVDRGEEVKAAAIRETEEECGLKIEIKNLLGVYSYPDQIPVVIVYVAQYLSGKIVPGNEALETRLFTAKQIPWQDLAFKNTEEALKDYYRLKN